MSNHPIVAPKKLIEVALPLDHINKACAREKSSFRLDGLVTTERPALDMDERADLVRAPAFLLLGFVAMGRSFGCERRILVLRLGAGLWREPADP